MYRRAFEIASTADDLPIDLAQTALRSSQIVAVAQPFGQGVGYFFGAICRVKLAAVHLFAPTEAHMTEVSDRPLLELDDNSDRHVERRTFSAELVPDHGTGWSTNLNEPALDQPAAAVERHRAHARNEG